MRGYLQEMLGARWHEFLPLYVGIAFCAIEFLVQVVRKRRLNAAKIGIMFSEGMAMCLLTIYGVALFVDQELAVEVAAKNPKVLGTAVLVAFITLAIHLYSNWFGRDEH